MTLLSPLLQTCLIRTIRVISVDSIEFLRVTYLSRPSMNEPFFINMCKAMLLVIPVTHFLKPIILLIFKRNKFSIMGILVLLWRGLFQSNAFHYYRQMLSSRKFGRYQITRTNGWHCSFLSLDVAYVISVTTLDEIYKA